MDTNQLSTSEVKFLISEFKHFLTPIKLVVPEIGKWQKDYEVKGQNSHLKYKLHIYRGNLIYKYTLHLRFLQTNIHLVRICINGHRHHNEDGTIVGVNHIHIYKFHDHHVEGYAYNLSEFPFDKDQELCKAIEDFFSYIHIYERNEGSKID